MKPFFGLLLVAGCASAVRAEDLKTVDAFHDAAVKAKSILTLPGWDQTPEAVEASVKSTIVTLDDLS